MKRKLLFVWVAIAVLFVAVIVATKVPLRSHVAISGTVRSGTSGDVVADAKVLITLRRNGFPFDSYSTIAIMTDADGHFVVDERAAHRFNDIFVEAITPDNEFGQVRDADDQVAIIASVLPTSLRGMSAFQYNTFCGGYIFGRDPDVKFIGRAWSIDETE